MYFTTNRHGSSNLAPRLRETVGMIRLRIREFNLEVIKPKVWELVLLLALGIVGWAAYGYLLR
jgi:hypothetical protein